MRAAPAPAQSAPPQTGLSAHAQALWRRAARYRELADTLDAPASAGAPRP